MKILHVNDNYTAHGGVQQYILSVGCLLDNYGHQNAILYTEQSASTIRRSAWPAYYVPLGDDFATRVQQVVDKEQPDVAYIHHVGVPETVERITQLLPAVAYIHGFAAVCPGLAKYYRRGDTVCTRPFGWGCVPMHYLRRCSAARRPCTLFRLMQNTAQLKNAYLQVPSVLVASDYMRLLLLQNGFSENRISILPPHFLEKSQFRPSEIKGTFKTILFAGRLEIEKGLPYLLQAVVQLPSEVNLIVAGDGSLRNEYQHLASGLGISDRVQFAGWMTEAELSELYDQCSVLVMPSIMPEPFGKVGIEALAHGCPVVAFEVGGISDWLLDNVNGILVKPADSTMLAQAISSLITNADRRSKFGHNGQRMVFERYSASEHITGLMRAFKRTAQVNA